MVTSDLKIGMQLKHARLVKKIRLKQLAEQINCSESLLSKIENGKAQPSLQTLHKLTNALDISIAKLFSKADSTDNEFIMKANERPTISFAQQGRKSPGIHLESIIPHANPCLLEANIHVVAPAGRSDGNQNDNTEVGTIVHEGEEVGYILTGQLELTIDGKIQHLEEGDSFFFDSTLEHGYRNPGQSETRVLWVSTPPTF